MNTLPSKKFSLKLHKKRRTLQRLCQVLIGCGSDLAPNRVARNEVRPDYAVLNTVMNKISGADERSSSLKLSFDELPET